ncbi:MAG TPA: DUF3090 domain-containing protein [Chloroflexi bacterium]|nr:DUF3090 domain-containing protein [Chloroflexota bacterium]HBY08880.1 DUF3090 domain-containing protein [Chloroflexota bacterium]
MPRLEIELLPVDHITSDALGPKGQRVFYIQATKGKQVVTLIAEKFQVQSLAVGVEQFLAEIIEKFPDIPDASADYDETLMRITPPVDPLFRLADIGLGYNSEDDLAVLVIHELLPEGSDEDDPGVVRLWCTRSQLRALGHWGMEVATRGRPICPQCGQPEEPEGHFCVKKNGGHKRN